MGRRNAQTSRVVDGEVLPSIPTLLEPRFSQSLERGLAILESFSPGEPVLGIADLADRLGMSRSTTHRYVITLVTLGYLRQVKGRKYRLGLAVAGLGLSTMSSTPLVEHARPYLEELRSRTGFAVSLAALDGSEVILLERVRGARRGQDLIDLGQAPGARLPAYCTATGKLLLAHLPEHELRHTLGEMTLRRHARRTVKSKTALREALGGIGKTGLACAEGEQAEGLLSIAAPVRGHSGELAAAVGMDAHESTISLGDLAGALGPHLIAAADRVSARLGYRRRDEQARAMPVGRQR